MRSPQTFLSIAPRGLRRVEAALYIGVSPSKFDELVRDNRMPMPFRVDSCTIWDVHDLDRAIDVLKDWEGRNPWDKENAA